MNIEYINLSDNTYAVTNEEGNIKVINCLSSPEKLLELKNEEEKLSYDILEKTSLLFKINSKIYLRKIIDLFLNSCMIIGMFLTLSNIKGFLAIIGLNICFKVIINELIGSKKYLKNKYDEVYGEELLTAENLEKVSEEIKSLEKKINYRQVYNYENYLNKSLENNKEKPFVRKLTLK